MIKNNDTTCIMHDAYRRFQLSRVNIVRVFIVRLHLISLPRFSITVSIREWRRTVQVHTACIFKISFAKHALFNINPLTCKKCICPVSVFSHWMGVTNELKVNLYYFHLMLFWRKLNIFFYYFHKLLINEKRGWRPTKGKFVQIFSNFNYDTDDDHFARIITYCSSVSLQLLSRNLKSILFVMHDFWLI